MLFIREMQMKNTLPATLELTPLSPTVPSGSGSPLGPAAVERRLAQPLWRAR